MKCLSFYLILLSLLVSTASVDSGEPQDQDDLNIMHGFYNSLETAFALSMDEEQLNEARNYQRMRDALESLTENAEILESHGRRQGQLFIFSQQSIVRSAYDAANSFYQTDYEEMHFSLLDLIEGCFSCHTRLPGQGQNEIGKQFIEQEAIQSLPLEERVKMEVMARQFDAALDTYKMLIETTPWDDPDVSFLETFGEYLKVALRVRDDVARPIALLNEARTWSDLPRSITEPINEWIVSLRALQSRPVRTDTLAYAKELIRDGQLKRLFPDDRYGMVEFIAASSVLHRYVRNKPMHTPDLAEAYYLLGVTESHTSITSWMSDTEYYLETAIRLQPNAPFANRAYAELEDALFMEYGGIREIDTDILDHLGELRKIIDRAKMKRK